MRFQEKKIFLKKVTALAVLAILILVSIMVVRHYFYVLDSYYYSAEFHVNFMKNNLRIANIELFTDYFESLETITKIFPMLLFSYLIQNFWVLFSKPILVSVTTSVVGLPPSTVLNYISLLLTGLISFWIGIFFFGDILPVLFKRKDWQDVSASRKYIAYGITGALFSVPIMPVIVPAFLGALARIRIRSVIMIMMIGSMIRLLLLITLSNAFI
jgi:hypothetical protein